MNKDNLLFRNNMYSLEERLADLVGSLTLKEKISLLSTSQSAIPRLKIDKYHVGGEAAHGVVDRSGGKTTVFPQPIGLSSTWNRNLMKEVGSVIGDEARVFYQLNDKKTGLTLWAPTIDMERDPRWGRTEEAYGEDPCLTGKLSTELIKGMQGEDDFYIKMVAAPKHFYGNNNEYGRGYISNSIDPRNRREYYLKAFEPAFKEGNALSMMTAYNGVNGIPCMQINEIKEVVRNEWGMEGFIVSDGGALSLNVQEYHYYNTHAEALADALKKGIDCFVDVKELVETSANEALEKKLITENDLTKAIRNTLKVRFRLGHFDDDHSQDPYYNVDTGKMCSDEHAAVALEATKESIVLLKNDNQMLPLKEGKTKKVAVIGPTADVIYKDWYTGYSPYQITPLEGLKKKLKNAEVSFVNGNDSIAIKRVKDKSYLTISDKGNKIIANSKTIGNEETFELEEWGWNGNLLRSKANNKYVCQQDNCPTFDVNNEEVFGWFVREKIAFQPLNDNLENYHLSTWKGEPLSVSGEKLLVASEIPEVFEKRVISSGIEEAVQIAKTSDVAIVFVGNNPMLNGRETEDRPDITLPEHQQELIEAVYEANPNTIVVVIGSYPFAMNWVNQHIPAAVYSSHGSQMLGEAVASVLYGDSSPSGRLSMTWYKDVQQLPSIFDYDIINGNSTYMYFDKEVLYPFGHGLSYTTFDYSSLQLDDEVIKSGGELSVSVTVENGGNVEGSEVVQLYATVLDSSVKRPKKQLIDFAKVRLKPREKQNIILTFKTDNLAVWDVDKEEYCLEKGRCLLSIGASSEDIRLSKEINVDGSKLNSRSLSHLTKAENYNDYQNVYINKGENELNCVTSRTSGWICFRNVKFEEGSNYFRLRATTDGMPGKISIRFNDLETDSISEKDIHTEYPWQWKDFNFYFELEEQVTDVYVLFDGSISLSTIQIL
ncbi:glycoside hydrolase family 3 C-terminal domain-containing protein [Aquibacillus rhizosphaerae]|uniref:Glycoside hydrolase family 3 C-terminal domain-containing protein n=1 Tax=Aquibacillus rhizosphaerae TaxID=3051431 RepID=A0ABT7L943_9BACI|nr:glycoside hydrolase family 3 C-terminal domain-containing protein [Aquibacillus sp. LR5S19]MDL4841894.1 glycoside hydrolase family 3 C-terminal domain-containing protein [Aquibacillus sp. LR5S19]